MEMNDDKELRRSTRANKGFLPPHLHDFLLDNDEVINVSNNSSDPNANKDQHLQSSSAQNPINPGSDGLANASDNSESNLNPPFQIHHNDTLSGSNNSLYESGDDNDTTVIQKQQNKIMSILTQLSTEFKNMKMQREADNIAREQFNRDIMGKISQFSNAERSNGIISIRDQVQSSNHSVLLENADINSINSNHQSALGPSTKPNISTNTNDVKISSSNICGTTTSGGPHMNNFNTSSMQLQQSHDTIVTSNLVSSNPSSMLLQSKSFAHLCSGGVNVQPNQQLQSYSANESTGEFSNHVSSIRMQNIEPQFGYLPDSAQARYVSPADYMNYSIFTSGPSGSSKRMDSERVFVPTSCNGQQTPFIRSFTSAPIEQYDEALHGRTKNVFGRTDTHQLPGFLQSLNRKNFAQSENENRANVNINPMHISTGTAAAAASLKPHPNEQYTLEGRRKLHDLPEFNGRPEQWPLFITAFKDSTNVFKYSNLENNLRLQKCLKGDAKRAVESLLIFPNNIEAVLTQLEFLYGRPECLIRSQITEVRRMSPIDEKHLELVIPFATKVNNLATFMTTTNSQQHLANPMLLDELIEKLPVNKRLDWVNYSVGIQPYPTIIDFSNWLNQIARLVCKIVPTTIGMNESNVEGRKSSKSGKKVVLHATQESIVKRSVDNKTAANSNCVVCEGNHRIYDCENFIKKKLMDRWSFVKEKRLCFSCLKAGHSTFACRYKKPCGKKGCRRFHNKMLHEDNENIQAIHNASSMLNDEAKSGSKLCKESAQSLLSCHTEKKLNSPGVLFKVVAVKLYGRSKVIDTYALLDDGSEVSIIDEDLASELDLQVESEKPLNLKWFGNITSSEKSLMYNIEICGIEEDCRRMCLRNVRTVKNLQLPTQSLCMDKLNLHHQYLRSIPIIDYLNAHPKILIGIDNCHVGVMRKINYGNNDEPVCIKTKLGTIVYGPTNSIESAEYPSTLFVIKNEQMQLEQLNGIVNDYFTTENFGVKATMTDLECDDDIRARQIMKDTTRRKGERYETGLLWSMNEVNFPPSLQMATRRLYGIEKKMKQDSEYAAQYVQNINHYLSSGYARKLSKIESDVHTSRTWYLPHFGVRNPSKPGKLRLVFDAAASVNGISLNSMLLTGPDQYQPLPKILHQFRQGIVAVCGDIREMFHQVHIRTEDQDSQRFLWRNELDGTVETYVMIAMTFGATCSPSSSQYVKNTNAMQFIDQYPQAVQAIVDHHYVDDYVKSFSSDDEAIGVTKTVTMIHKYGGFTLRNFISNSTNVINALKDSDECRDLVSLSMSQLPITSEKVLGMYWDTLTDTLTFKFNFNQINDEVLNFKRYPTKRELLSIIMSIFDPFGLIANFTIYAKLMIQDIWKLGINWDEPIPEQVFKRWKIWQLQLKDVERFSVPRCYSPEFLTANNLQIHVFVDASESAFAASVYVRYVNKDNEIKVIFIAGKTKCAPQKLLSVPRLELQAAVLGTRLLTSIKSCHDVKFDQNFLWSDSNTVVQWVRSDHRKYKPFVAHRIAEILETTKVSEWHWVPTRENPADDATRAKHIPSIDSGSRWILGPAFLRCDQNDWPKQEKIRIDNDDLCEKEMRPKYKRVMLLFKNHNLINMQKFSTFTRLLRVTAWMFRYLHNCGIKIPSERRHGELLIGELQLAENYLCRKTQMDSYAEEYHLLLSEKCIDKSSSLYQLTPYLDGNGVMRVYGRVDNADIMSFCKRRPIILPKNHHFTNLVVKHHHELMKHTHQEAVICSIREKFWIPSVRVVVKKIRNNCVTCKIHTAKPKIPLMGQLPMDRLTPYVRPFTYSGLDYFGPVNVTIGRRNEKRWIALFTCMTVRAVHIELAADLSTDACLICIRNFVNRRGVPVRIRSDNGTNFVGAQRELVRIDDFLDHTVVQSELSKQRIEWVFNCPANPHAGGCWERLVKSIKKVLMFTLKEIAPQVETLRSYLIEAENIVNSRPLTHVPVSIDDEEPITPNHFLLGTSNSTQTPNNKNETFSYRKQWRISKQLKDCFWKRWISEYLPILTRRSKWCETVKPIQVNELVLICDGDLPRNKWVRGRVTKVYMGKDDQVRLADIQTASGVLRRPASKIAVLDVSGKSSQAIYGGGDVDDRHIGLK